MGDVEEEPLAKFVGDQKWVEISKCVGTQFVSHVLSSPCLHDIDPALFA